MRLKASDPSPPTTRDALRAMAEEMYAELGINGVTTRRLAERAGVNIAAVNYHFGNKDNLMLEVFRNVCRMTVKNRLDALDEIEARAASAGRRPDLKDIVEAFVDAYINEGAPRIGALLAHFVLKHRVEPSAWTRAIVAEELDGLALRYIASFQSAAPNLTAQQAHWRYHMMVSSIVMTLSDETTGGRIARLSGGQCQPLDRHEFREEMVAFIVNAIGGDQPS